MRTYVHNRLSSPQKLLSICLVSLLGVWGASIAQETSTAEPSGDQITFVTSDENVQSIIREQRAFPSIDEAVSKVIPNHLIFYRSSNGNHKVHKVVEVSETTEWSDAGQILSTSTTSLSNVVVEPEPPQIESPVGGSAIDGRKAQISWKPGNRAVKDWYLHVSTVDDGRDLLDSGDISAETTSYVVDNLPGNKSTIHVKLWYREHGSSVWQNIKSTFLSNVVEPEPPQLDRLLTGSAVHGSQTTIAWKVGEKAVSKWSLHVGTNENGKDLLDSGDISSETTSYVVNNLPEDGSTIYVTLAYQEHGRTVWRNVSTTFSSTKVPYSEDLIALYNFDGDLADSSGNDLHGISTAPPKFQSSAEGRSTVHFDGVDDHIVLGRSGKLDFSDSKTFTFAAWVKLPDTSPLFDDDDVLMSLISRYNKGIAGEYYLDLRKSGRVGLLRETAPFEKHSATRIVPNQFSFVAGTFDGSVARLYVDGLLGGETPMGPSASASTTDVVLGASYRRGKLENYFQGEMDKLMIYDRALTETEILSMFKADINTEYSNVVSGSDRTAQK